jgi:hypothetical protein
MILCLALAGCDVHQQEAERKSPIARFGCHDIGDAPALRYTELDDGTAFVIIGKHTATEHMTVLIRRSGSKEWESLRGAAKVPPAVLEAAP